MLSRPSILLVMIAFTAPAAMAGDYKSSSSGTPAPIHVVNNQGSDAERSACTPDVFRLCGQYIPRANLSPACRAVFR
jgi:hypothetical protein